MTTTLHTHTSQITHCFTLQQLRAVTQAGGVAGVSLKGHGNAFFIQAQLRTGQHAVLVTARSDAPRMFKSPAQAFSVLRRIGIVTGSFDITHYAPEQQQTTATKAAEAEKAGKIEKKAKRIKAAKAAKAVKQAIEKPIPTDESPSENIQQSLI